MSYYKTSELEKFGVSRRTVSNWIEKAKHGRLELALVEAKGKFYIAKTATNQAAVQKLVGNNRKYINRKSLKTVTPKPEFYELFQDEHVLGIISNISTYREIPLQYTYFDDGAEYWNRHTLQLAEDKRLNPLNSTISLLDANIGYLDKVLEDFTYVNVVDVGVGNALPTRKLLEHLLDAGKLKRYAAVDISRDMLAIAEKNIGAWFGDRIRFESYVNDISFEPFADVIAEPPDKDAKTTNLVLLLGGTLANFRAPEDALKVIRKSMGPNDLFAYGLKLDSPVNREQFDFRISGAANQSLPPQCKFMLDLLGIQEDFYTVETGFNEREQARYARIRLKHALSIDFESPRGPWRVDLNKDDALIVWWAKHSTASDVVELLSANGFNPLLTSQLPDHDYMLVLADLRCDIR